MKQVPLSIRKTAWLLITGAILAATLCYCSDETVLEVAEPEIRLKAFHGIPDYQDGQWYVYRDIINNDSIEVLIPPVWNGQFIVYAHGYVNPNLPIHLPDDIIGGMPLSQLITSANFGYASTSYSENGFAVKEGVIDVLYLGNQLKAHFKPHHIFLGGVSEGGLVVMKTLERNQKIFEAGLISCAPVGNFRMQLNYFGNFHVLFNYLYTDELLNYPGGSIDLGNPQGVPPLTMDYWSNGFLDAPLLWVISQEEWKLPLLFQLTGVPTDFIPNEEYMLLMLRELLRFNIMATNDMIERLGGVPFDNTETWYQCDIPFNYEELNAQVQRIKGDKQAFHHMERLYETKGTPNVPVVLMHTMGDHVTPFWHFEQFMTKVAMQEGNHVIPFPVERYGHCNYELEEVLGAIQLMINQ